MNNLFSGLMQNYFYERKANKQNTCKDVLIELKSKNQNGLGD